MAILSPLLEIRRRGNQSFSNYKCRHKKELAIASSFKSLRLIFQKVL